MNWDLRSILDLALAVMVSSLDGLWQTTPLSASVFPLCNMGIIPYIGFCGVQYIHLVLFPHSENAAQMLRAISLRWFLQSIVFMCTGNLRECLL